MRKRNKRIFFFYLCLIIFTALLFGLLSGLKSETGQKSGKVKILIFSKHVKLLQNGEINSLELIFPNGTSIDTDSGRVYSKKLSVSFVNNSFIIKSDDRIIRNADLIIHPQKKNDVFQINLNDEKRIYPLPLFISAAKDRIEFSVEADVDQYAVDSAWSELGFTPEQNLEALYSLAYIIKARTELTNLRNKHKGYDFCDLTCCQTYKGLSGKTFNTDISIKTDEIKHGLFFHSSSGGRLFTENIFNNMTRDYPPPRDIIFSERLVLSRNNFMEWDAAISEIELADILYNGKRVSLNDMVYDMEKELMFIATSPGDEVLSPENFRIKINRVKGWNFIKSNNYVLTRKNGNYVFKGSGLGHGAGLSMEGAVQLAERGYSAYEILEHYYPDIQYKYDIQNKSGNNLIDRFQYIVFDYSTGKTIAGNSSDSFRNRVIPCGSLFKLFAAIYLAYERTDLFYNYVYTCTDKQDDKSLPEYCWNKTGHGRMNLMNGLPHSCNKYFASLYRKINQDEFNKWLFRFIAEHGIKLYIPEINRSSDFPNILAGLNFDVSITVDGLIKLNRFLYRKSLEGSSEKFAAIFNSLHRTFIDGTAKDENSSASPMYNESIKKLWGKTGTVIAGTNKHYGYGIFTGGSDSVGIISILRKGSGAGAAKEAKGILLNSQFFTPSQ
jgi:hypothetical protein